MKLIMSVDGNWETCMHYITIEVFVRYTCCPKSEDIIGISKYIVHGSKNDLFKYDLVTLEHYLSKRVRRFDPSTTGLDHVLVPRVLPQTVRKIARWENR